METVRKWLKISNKLSRDWNEKSSVAQWNYETNISQENSNKLISLSIKHEKWMKDQAYTAKMFLGQLQFDDLDMKRQLILKSVVAVPASENILREQKITQQQMSKLYSESKLCLSRKCLSLEPDLLKIMSDSRDPNQLLWAWKGWRDVIGPSSRDLFSKHVYQLNIGAKNNGFDDIGQYQRQKYYEHPEIIQSVSDQLLQEVMPLYIELHTYVRHRLSQYYGPNIIKNSLSTIPAHILGDMWGQSWGNIYSIVQPFPLINIDDFDALITNLSTTSTQLQEKSVSFYTSIGLSSMMPKFWKKSITKYQTIAMDCHPKAFDFFRQDDFRIKMCANAIVSAYDWNVVHHEMGHLEYYMAYRHQPDVYRKPANPAIDEAIGDTLTMFASSHLRHMHILVDKESKKGLDYKRKINILMREALDKIPSMLFSYVLEKWRWLVYRGDITTSNYTKSWWKMRYHFQGIHPPVKRFESDFDPGSKYHVLADIPYIRYFLSTILQYQIHESLCQVTKNIASQRCDITGSQEAGAKLLDFMKLGAKLPWPESLKQLTGSANISSEPIWNYFHPLYKWLKTRNDRHFEVNFSR
ncbi:angiotensin-converting enzyme-like [Argonauta hians]